jgi:nucleoside-diphosphate-sugar epimerase
MSKVLLCGATGFIGRNFLEYFLERPDYEIVATYHRTPPPDPLLNKGKVKFIQADLTRKENVDEAIQGAEIVVQAAATTSGAKDIVAKPYYHVTDNVVMSSLLFRACHENRVRHVVFFSCTVMYPSSKRPVREEDFNCQVADQYFGAGWTKAYLEKMCEFYSRIGPTRYTAIRHSNIYGPFDKYDLEKSHVFGATVAKVMSAPEPGTIVVWGDGAEERDLLYVDDLIAFVDKVLTLQKSQFELVNVGAGQSISVRNLVEKIVKQSGKRLEIEFDRTRPSIPFNLRLNIDRAINMYQWRPKSSLDEGIAKTLQWYRSNYLEDPRAR